MNKNTSFSRNKNIKYSATHTKITILTTFHDISGQSQVTTSSEVGEITRSPSRITIITSVFSSFARETYPGETERQINFSPQNEYPYFGYPLTEILVILT